jgi:hypothetical protein
MRRSYIAVIALLATVLAGCASSPALLPPRPPRSAIPAQALRVACPGGTTAAARRSAALPEQAIPAGFIPVAVVLCDPGIVFVNHSGRNVPPVRQIATTGLGMLMTALRAPSAPQNSNVKCLDQAIYTPWFVVVGRNGKVIRPKIPVTVCGDPSPAVLASLNALAFRKLR